MLMEKVRIVFPPAAGVPSNNANAAVEIQCLSELTPLDAIEMSCGRGDPTGLCVWLGAFLFLEMLLVRKAEMENPYWSTIRHTCFPRGARFANLELALALWGLRCPSGGFAPTSR